jgi:exopolysaccharide biosynthesis protein
MVLSLSPSLASLATKLEPGSIVKISTATLPSLVGVRCAIGGGFVIVNNGKAVKLELPQSNAYKYRSVTEFHPRAAIGASRDYIYFVEVDGRQRSLSKGMTLEELGDYMAKLGCELALNLDGGASATFWLNGRVMNSPSSGREREIANGVVLTIKPGGGKSP